MKIDSPLPASLSSSLSLPSSLCNKMFPAYHTYIYHIQLPAEINKHPLEIVHVPPPALSFYFLLAQPSLRFRPIAPGGNAQNYAEIT